MDVLGTDFEALVLIFPDNRGIKFEQLWGELTASMSEEPFRLLGRLFERALIVAAFALPIVPMRHCVGAAIFVGPRLQLSLQGRRQILEGDEGIAAMLANETCFPDIAS